MKFEETYLNDNILDALYDMHFEDMTPIQERCIPEILDGYDVLGVAQTGTVSSCHPHENLPNRLIRPCKASAIILMVSVV